MGNGTPEGFVGQMFQITARHAPPPPGMQPPALWGVEKVVTERLNSGRTEKSRSLDTTKQDLDRSTTPSVPPRPWPSSENISAPPKPLSRVWMNPPARKLLAADLTQHWTKNNLKVTPTTR